MGVPVVLFVLPEVSTNHPKRVWIIYNLHIYMELVGLLATPDGQQTNQTNHSKAGFRKC